MSCSTPTKRALVILFDEREEGAEEEAIELLELFSAMVEHTPFDYVLIDDFPK